MTFIKNVYKKVLLSILIVFCTYVLVYTALLNIRSSGILNNKENLALYNENLTTSLEFVDESTKTSATTYPAAFYSLNTEYSVSMMLTNYLISSLLLGSMIGTSYYFIKNNFKFFKLLIYLVIGSLILLLSSSALLWLVYGTFKLDASLISLYIVIYVSICSLQYSKKFSQKQKEIRNQNRKSKNA